MNNNIPVSHNSSDKIDNFGSYGSTNINQLSNSDKSSDIKFSLFNKPKVV